MIQFLLTEGHRYTLEELVKEPRAPRIRALTYDALIRSRRLPRATYIFSDFDRLAYSDLELVARLYRQMKEAGLRVLNDPARVKKRYSLLRALHEAGLNDFNVYRAEELPAGIRFPVYIRKMQGHGEPCTDLLPGRDEVERELARAVDAGVPLEHLMVIEYVGEEVRPGLYRKLSAFRMDDKMLPYICAHEKQWLVKRGTMGIAGEELYQEEHRIVRENTYAEPLRKVFEMANIDYGRADFGFYRGRLQVFEINTNPHLVAPGPHSFPIRLESMALVWEKIIKGFRGLDCPSGGSVLLPKDRLLRPHRQWSRFFTRTRLVE